MFVLAVVAHVFAFAGGAFATYMFACNFVPHTSWVVLLYFGFMVAFGASAIGLAAMQEGAYRTDPATVLLSVLAGMLPGLSLYGYAPFDPVVMCVAAAVVVFAILFDFATIWQAWRRAVFNYRPGRRFA